MNVGDYVRTKSGLIGKLMDSNGYDENKIAILINDTKDIKITPVIDKEQITKSSPNIIDLLKKKDITIDYKGNIYQVVKVWDNYVFTDKKNKYGQVITLVDYQIKSIVTREQFSQMEYRL